MTAPVTIDTSFEDSLIDTVRISNLHCSSCVHTIKKALYALSPAPSSVQVSLVSQSVTICYPKDLSSTTVQSTLEDAGFELWTNLAPKANHVFIGSVQPTFEVANQVLVDRQTKHIEQCSLCQQEAFRDAGDFGKSVDLEINVPVPDRNIHAAKKTVRSNHATSVISRYERRDDGPFRVVLSVGGMTCSSCSLAIINTVSELRGVSGVVVSVLAGSATVVIEDKSISDVLVKTIEDCGFEAEIVTAEPLTASIAHGQTHLRTLKLRVDGMFCQQCPEKIMAAVKSLDPPVNIIKPIGVYTDHILELSYQPTLPYLTIRTIISTISAAKSPPFQVSIYHPPSLEDRARSMQAIERNTLFRRLIVAVIISMPTFVIGVVFMSLVKEGNSTRAFLMKPMWTGNTSLIQWALFFLASPVQFYCAGIFHRKSIKEIRSLWRRGSMIPIYKRLFRFGSMNLLVSAGISVAYFSSVGLLGLAAVQQASRTRMGDSTTYFDSVVFLTTFLLAGRCLEVYSKSRTADAISALALLRPPEALLLSRGGSLEETIAFYSFNDDIEKGGSGFARAGVPPGLRIEKISAGLLEIGDIVRIQHGATPPADATIVLGASGAFDESSLTGESRLIQKALGDKVFLGTVNKGEVVDARVDAIGGATMLDHIVEVVREGQTRRAPIERAADFIISYFVPVVTLLAILTWLAWLILGLSGSLPQDYLDITIGGWPVWSLEFAIAVFVVACPCGIGLAAPTALLVGSGLAAGFGILARGGGEAFQEMAQVDVVVFDKTGTLSKGGDPAVTDFEILLETTSRWELKTVLGVAAELESVTSHPLGAAIRSFCEARDVLPLNGSTFEEVAGRGVKAYFEDMCSTAIIGNEAWLEGHGTVMDDIASRRLETWKSEAKSVALLAIRDESGDHKAAESFVIAAIFAIADPLRPEAQSVVSCLQNQGIYTWIISGDNGVTTRAVAQAVGIPMTNVIAGVLPHEKAQKIQWLQRAGEKRRRKSMFGKRAANKRCVVAMVGDGINDAPALTVADIGIAIGSGSDVAISSASFILLTSDLRSLLTLVDLSRKVFNRVKFNFLYAGMYNIIALPIAAGILYPAGRIRLAPVWASLAMALSSVSVVCSSLLLKLYKEPKIPLK